MEKSDNTTDAKVSTKVSEPPVRLWRFQDRFMTDPMPTDEAKAMLAGYPGEYCYYDDWVAGKYTKKPAAKSKED